MKKFCLIGFLIAISSIVKADNLTCPQERMLLIRTWCYEVTEYSRKNSVHTGCKAWSQGGGNYVEPWSGTIDGVPVCALVKSRKDKVPAVTLDFSNTNVVKEHKYTGDKEENLNSTPKGDNGERGAKGCREGYKEVWINETHFDCISEAKIDKMDKTDKGEKGDRGERGAKGCKEGYKEVWINEIHLDCISETKTDKGDKDRCAKSEKIIEVEKKIKLRQRKIKNLREQGYGYESRPIVDEFRVMELLETELDGIKNLKCHTR